MSSSDMRHEERRNIFDKDPAKAMPWVLALVPFQLNQQILRSH